jgi:DMSO/TMAO reductase YedYZ molybdopterin-dependent catalytic subunit
MGLFIVRHQHEPDHCPAGDPDLGGRLLTYLSRPSVRQQGIEVKGEAVVSGEHTLYLILEAADAATVEGFLDPFRQAGTVEVLPASTCARVVASGGCAAPAPALDDAVPAVDPEMATQDAIDAGLVVHRAHPLNCETSLPALIGGVVMPNARFYVRNHFQIPDLDATTWRLDVGGLVDRPLRLSLADLGRLPSSTLPVTLECAGNGRAAMDPPVPGEQWRLGAVSTAEWTGVPLTEVLDRAGVRPGARAVVFRGADSGTVDGEPGTLRFERGLSLDDVRDGEALLAYAMNGEPLPVAHGFPVRLVVPGWYAVASVKWLTQIDVIDRPFAGYYQEARYQYEWEGDGGIEREPVRLQQVRALVTQPRPGNVVPGGELVVRGVAWSGAAPVARVDVSIGDGPWQQATLVGERRRHSWRWWELVVPVEGTGVTTVRARATDLAGRTQPEENAWNRLGYGGNAIQRVEVQLA